MDPIARRLLAWYAQNKRDLPWRKTRDPYRIFISELMLQQTQVDRVIPKYRSFLKKFPTWKSLAGAKTADLIRAWAGLGYNRRVLYAREAARTVMTHHVPRTMDEWRTLKGVGPYSAAALTEFAGHTRALVIDTNIRRVIGRITLGRPFPELRDDPRILKALERLTPQTGAHWDLPQATMDFANAVCLPRDPLCATCPLGPTCKAAHHFLSGKKMVRKTRRPTERIHTEKRYPDRIYRGRILALVRQSRSVRTATLGPRIDPTFDPIADADWIRSMVSRLIQDGLLVEVRRGIVSLPNS